MGGHTRPRSYSYNQIIHSSVETQQHLQHAGTMQSQSCVQQVILTHTYIFLLLPSSSSSLRAANLSSSTASSYLHTHTHTHRIRPAVADITLVSSCFHIMGLQVCLKFLPSLLVLDNPSCLVSSTDSTAQVDIPFIFFSGRLQILNEQQKQLSHWM